MILRNFCSSGYRVMYGYFFGRKCSYIDSSSTSTAPFSPSFPTFSCDNNSIVISSSERQPVATHISLSFPSFHPQQEEMKLLGDTNDYPVTHETECVLCLDVFTEDNPMIPTLCACGESKSHFHYQCLYAWMEKSSSCPTCSSGLFFQVIHSLYHTLTPPSTQTSHSLCHSKPTLNPTYIFPIYLSKYIL